MEKKKVTKKVTKKVVFLAYDDMELLDLSGAQTAIYEAQRILDGGYEIEVVGFAGECVTSEAGTQILPGKTIRQIRNCHTLIIPGGRGARLGPWSETRLNQLRRLIARSERVVGICTGSFLLAATGLPDGTRVATHWASLDEFEQRYPRLSIDRDSLYVNDRKFWFSAGVTSGIDLTLRLIELDFGPLVATQVARQLVVFLKRSGSQRQYSDFLNIQEPKTNRVAGLIVWLKSHLTDSLSVQGLAKQANVSERHLYRLFVEETGLTPTAYIEQLRMETARTLLITSGKDAKQIGLSVGFKSYDGFRRAFKRTYSTTPAHYRETFGGHL